LPGFVTTMHLHEQASLNPWHSLIQPYGAQGRARRPEMPPATYRNFEV
jgi:hypothetical protein